jgi:DNA (cytosine-5)-methyltransferase 1
MTKSKKKLNTNNTNNYVAMSLFSGLGGDTQGLEQCGINVKYYSEFVPVFCESHEANFPHSELIGKDVKSDISKISDDTLKKYSDIDILFAGFPCQGFSQAGKKMDDDPRNTLFREFLRVAKITQPSMIIGENVKGLLSRKTTSGENYIDVIVNEFTNLGYNVKYKVMKAHKHNVPQKRERLIIVGVKENDYNWESKHPDDLHNEPNLINIVKYSMEGTVKVDDSLFDGIPENCILSDLEDETDESSNSHPYLLSKLYPKDNQLTYNGKTYTNLFSFGKRDSPIHCEIIDIRNPCKTIICSYDHQPRFFVPIKNKKGCYLRCLLPDELKQIQGFPDNYILKGNWKQQVVQIGNAVPPPLIKSVVENIIK